jgi:hypothetical protein
MMEDGDAWNVRREADWRTFIRRLRSELTWQALTV